MTIKKRVLAKTITPERRGEEGRGGEGRGGERRGVEWRGEERRGDRVRGKRRRQPGQSSVSTAASQKSMAMVTRSKVQHVIFIKTQLA